MSYPQRLPPWLASLLGLGWLLGLALPGLHAGAFRVAETRPRDPRAAALWQHPQVAQALRVWTAVATEIFHIPSDLAHSIGFSGRQMGFDHRIGHFRPLRMATRVVEYHIYLRLGRFGLAKRQLGWPTP